MLVLVIFYFFRNVCLTLMFSVFLFLSHSLHFLLLQTFHSSSLFLPCLSSLSLCLSFSLSRRQKNWSNNFSTFLPTNLQSKTILSVVTISRNGNGRTVQFQWPIKKITHTCSSTYMGQICWGSKLIDSLKAQIAPENIS